MSWRCEYFSIHAVKSTVALADYRTPARPSSSTANSQRTGANEAPLANQRGWGGGGGGPPSGGRPQDGYGGQSSYAPPPMSGGGPPGERKRKSRWGDENDKIQVAGLPTAISGDVNSKDLENYAVHLRLEEIGRKLRSGDVVPPERERSPSPPPTYDHQGRRTNTRDIRYRKKLEDERNRLVDRAMRSDPNYKPPTEYLMAKRMGGRPSEKIYLPVKEFPEIKWIGLVLGPRGNSLKQMERETGAKIVIRGKGSTKEGKTSYGNRAQDEDDELHCNITADTQEKVDACVKLVNRVIQTAASMPDEQNEHKRMQLRELAMLNGTLRDDENQPCQNCGKVGHRKYDCPEQRNFTANVVCRNCGGMGHMARDCIAHRNKAAGEATPQFDSEYSALMAELGEGPPGGASGPAGGNNPGGPDVGGQGYNAAPPAQPLKALPPWRIPSNWHPPQPPNQGPGGRGGGGYTYTPVGPQPGAAGGYGGYEQPGAAGYGGQQTGGAGYDYSSYYSSGQQTGYGQQDGYPPAAGYAQAPAYGTPAAGYGY
ncbi:hypothetical protein EMMF5_001092 [Cystobasidiomycetes sp. EMM_F5]